MGDGLAEAEGVTDGEDDLADAGFGGVAHFEWRESFGGVDFEDGDVEEWVVADEACLVLFAGVEGDLKLGLAGDDVVVGDDVALVGDDGAGALALGGIIPEASAAPDV